MIRLLLATLFLAASSAASATTYYVGTYGSDSNDCLSTKTPCLTIQATTYKVAPGDTVQILTGDYKNNVYISRGGSKGHYITFNFAKNARVVANPQQQKVFLFDIAAPWIRVQNGEFVGTLNAFTYADAQAAYSPGKKYTNQAINQVCIEARANHVLVMFNYVHDCSSAGIATLENDDVTISNNTVERTNWWSSDDGSGIDVHYGKTPTDGEPVHGFVVANNIVRDSANAVPFWQDPAGSKPTDGNGIIVDLLQGEEAGYAGRVSIQGNTIERSGGSGIRAYKSAGVDMDSNSSFGAGRCPVSGADCGAQKNGEINYNQSSGSVTNNNTTSDQGNYAAFFNKSQLTLGTNTFKGPVYNNGVVTR